jgi:hypothetical protein
MTSTRINGALHLSRNRRCISSGTPARTRPRQSQSFSWQQQALKPKDLQIFSINPLVWLLLSRRFFIESADQPCYSSIRP